MLKIRIDLLCHLGQTIHVVASDLLRHGAADGQLELEQRVPQPVVLHVQTELLQPLQQGLLITRHKGLQVGVHSQAHVNRLLLHLQLDAAEKNAGTEYIKISKC